MAGAAPHIGRFRRFAFGYVSRENGHHANTALMRRHHDTIGLLLGHAENALQDRDDELARREIVVYQYHLMKPRPLGFRRLLRASYGIRIAHRIQAPYDLQYED